APRYAASVARPSGGNSEYLIGRKKGLVASVRAGRIIRTRSRRWLTSSATGRPSSLLLSRGNGGRAEQLARLEPVRHLGRGARSPFTAASITSRNRASSLAGSF